MPVSERWHYDTPLGLDESSDGAVMNPERSASNEVLQHGIEAVWDRAYERALELGRRTGTPVWIMQDGRIVDALAEEREDAAKNGEHDVG